jgi:hypothetical protein
MTAAKNSFMRKRAGYNMSEKNMKKVYRRTHKLEQVHNDEQMQNFGDNF